ncbi:MAG: FKBP-type peptidyl-prolyl cis-trans isomerase [Saprospiraceae bacterium]|nr:MAG: FKBP-type peptidyl-prolyl cis-trans isomerase [Saprospiraceae bacterium]
MKRAMIVMAGLCLASFLKAQELKTYGDSLSYAVGVLWGQNLKQQGLGDVNAGTVGQAIGAVLADKEPIIDIKSANDMVKNHINQKKEVQKQKNLEDGREFLSKNKERKGVMVTSSGLQYEILREGSGPTPTAADKVRVHYHGTLICGTVFDSSVERGEPITFPVTGVIPGWVEALQMMQVGAKWKLFIPSNLAYGERGAGAQIGPNATLIFEVELLGIE